MLKVLTSSQIKEVDAFTIRHEGIASIELMERACRAFVNWFTPRFDATKKIGVVCGTGNNGGDGLGIARLLYDWGYHVKVWIVRGASSESEDFKTNLSRLPDRIEVVEVTAKTDRGIFIQRDVLIDAIFGTGLSRPLEGLYAQVIECFNTADAVRISVDVPSGLSTNEQTTGAVVKADFTVTFQLPKLAFFLPQNHAFTGEWCIADIGLSKAAIVEAQADHFYLQKKDIRKMIKSRSRFDHKGSFGHALLVAGSYGKMGAAILSGRAALRAGLGLLTIHAPTIGNAALQIAVPEAMTTTSAGAEHLTKPPDDISKYDVIGIGPGLGQHPETVKAFESILRNYTRPIVIDADALNILSSKSELLHLIPQNSILTPHPREFERLVGTWKNDFERLEKLKNFAAKTQCFIILKGAFTTIATPEKRIYFNPTGNPGMATGGTGDVLTGILTGLLAQDYTVENCCLAGVYLHGLAGDLASVEKGMASMIASDLTEFLPAAFKKVQRE